MPRSTPTRSAEFPNNMPYVPAPGSVTRKVLKPLSVAFGFTALIDRARNQVLFVRS
jgi:hypothetical protein